MMRSRNTHAEASDPLKFTSSEARSVIVDVEQGTRWVNGGARLASRSAGRERRRMSRMRRGPFGRASPPAAWCVHRRPPWRHRTEVRRLGRQFVNMMCSRFRAACCRPRNVKTRLDRARSPKGVER